MLDSMGTRCAAHRSIVLRAVVTVLTAGWLIACVAPRVSRIMKILGFIGLAGSVYAIIQVDTYDDEVDDIIDAMDAAKAETDPLQRKIMVLAIAGDIRHYLNHFDSTPSTDLVALGMIDHIIGQDDW